MKITDLFLALSNLVDADHYSNYLLIRLTILTNLHIDTNTKA